MLVQVFFNYVCYFCTCKKKHWKQAENLLIFNFWFLSPSFKCYYTYASIVINYQKKLDANKFLASQLK